MYFYFFIIAIIIYFNFIHLCSNSGFKQKLLRVGKILLVEMGRSFANYFCGVGFCSIRLHVSGVSRSRETEEAEAEVVFIWHHNCNRKILGVCCCFWANLHFVSPWADWARSACEPLFWLSHSDERMAEWRSCASPSTAPILQALW